MKFKITLYNGNPIFLEEEQGKQVMSAWASGVEKIVLADTALASSNIATIEKIDEEPDYPKLEMPTKVYNSEKHKQTCELLDKIRAELSAKIGWKNQRDKFGNLITTKVDDKNKVSRFAKMKYWKLLEEFETNKGDRANKDERNKLRVATGLELLPNNWTI
uniref:Uncharacterized protein n=1 Tax=viral metagenome TaxID=1070528 RepID=A0A6M3JUA3_9ZZZZ